MKKLIIMMVVLGTVAFGRDNSYNANRDVDRYVNVQEISNGEKLSRVAFNVQDNISRYSDFHNELDRMDRGHEDR